MRVAAVQLRIEPGRRAATLQAALAAVDRASRTDPAPDLIVLPAFCDVPEVLAGESRGGEPLQGPTVAAMAHRARQWGVFICLGMARQSDEGRLRLATVLLDRDGDVRADHHAARLKGGMLECFAPAGGYVRVECLLGGIVPAAGPDLEDDGLWDAAAGADVVVAPSCFLPAPRHPTPDRETLCIAVRQAAKRANVGCVLADVMTAADGQTRIADGRSMIIDRSGGLVASSRPNQADILWACLT
jgi:predicted amidohydrolase